MNADTPTLIVAASSSWCLRAWLTLNLAAVKFDTQVVELGEDEDSMLADLSPTKLVPVLHHGDAIIHDSLAIVEYVNETWADGVLWPEKPTHRALARSLCAELHSGFTTIRRELPFGYDRKPLAKLSAGVEQELARITHIWQRAQDEYYFPQAGIVDAFYAVMALRLDRYGITLGDGAGAYQSQLLSWPLVSQGVKASMNWADG